jgi:hypothetical protein
MRLSLALGGLARLVYWGVIEICSLQVGVKRGFEADASTIDDDLARR